MKMINKMKNYVFGYFKMDLKYIVGVPCISIEGGERVLNIVIRFRGSAIRDELVDNGFDTVLDELNDIIKRKYGEHWSVDDAPELDIPTKMRSDIKF